MTPLDVVKIRLQAQKTLFSKGNPAQGRQGAAASPPGEQPAGMSQLAELVAGMSRLWSVGPLRGGRLLWAPRPHGLGGPAGGAGLMLGSVLPPPQPSAEGVSAVPGSPQPSRQRG